MCVLLYPFHLYPCGKRQEGKRQPITNGEAAEQFWIAIFGLPVGENYSSPISLSGSWDFLVFKGKHKLN